MSAPEYLAYHDDEWGKPVTSVQGIYERMTLEAFQSGLSWITILRKRENFRRAFAEFRPEGVSAFNEDDVARLLSDPGIVRNRAKITAAIENARLVVDLGPKFAEIVIGYREIGRPRPAAGEWRATSPESVAMARKLKGLGFRFFGPTTDRRWFWSPGASSWYRLGAPHGGVSVTRLTLVRFTDKSAKKRWWLMMMMSDSSALRRISVIKQRR
jgi:DNA-3-methyladenine glycosylase I